MRRTRLTNREMAVLECLLIEDNRKGGAVIWECHARCGVHVTGLHLEEMVETGLLDRCGQTVRVAKLGEELFLETMRQQAELVYNRRKYRR